MANGAALWRRHFDWLITIVVVQCVGLSLGHHSPSRSYKVIVGHV